MSGPRLGMVTVDVGSRRIGANEKWSPSVAGSSCRIKSKLTTRFDVKLVYCNDSKGNSNSSDQAVQQAGLIYRRGGELSAL